MSVLSDAIGWPSITASTATLVHIIKTVHEALDRRPEVKRQIEIMHKLEALGLLRPKEELELMAQIIDASPPTQAPARIDQAPPAPIEAELLPAPIAAPAPIEAPAASAAASAATKPAKPRRKATRPKRTGHEQLARQRKRAVLVAELEAQWLSIEADLSEAPRNGLKAAAQVQHGIWDKPAAVAWAKSRGKWRTEAEIISHPASVWSGLGAKHKRA